MQRQNLRLAYSRKVAERDARQLDAWRLRARVLFLEKLKASKSHSLIEIGSGPGRDAAFFSSQGVDVIATDLTPENAYACHQKGLMALSADALHAPFASRSFEAAFSINCLLHLPKIEWPLALQEIHRLLQPGSPFYFAVWGGMDQEGIYAEDSYAPKRFFAFHTDKDLKKLLAAHFEIERFDRFAESASDLHAQSFILLAKDSPA